MGETGNTVAGRFYQYKYNILKKIWDTQILVIEHFITHGWPAFRATVLDDNPQWTLDQRRKTESSSFCHLSFH